MNLRRLFRHLVGLAVCALALPATAVSVGEVAPDFDLPATPASGTSRVKLSSLRGQWVYVDFWASWCGPCRQSFPWMNELQARYPATQLRIIGINVDKHVAEAQKFLADTRPQFMIAFDAKGETPAGYAIKGMPTSVLVDPEGKVAFVHNGFHSEDRGELDARIARSVGTPKSR